MLAYTFASCVRISDQKMSSSATCFALLLTGISIYLQVGLKHPLEDEDVVQIVLKVCRLQIVCLYACLYALRTCCTVARVPDAAALAQV